MVKRFDEEASALNHTSGNLVVCPSCSDCAVSRGGQLSCKKCGYNQKFDIYKMVWYGKVIFSYKGYCQKCFFRFTGKNEHYGSLKSKVFVTRCPECNASVPSDIISQQHVQNGITDPDFGLDLWLQTTCKNHILWAKDESHIEFLEDYIDADLRERKPNINRSMASRLPSWMKQASNRKHVMAGLKRLRKKLESADL